MSGHVANDNKFGRRVFRYHPRSDEHSKKLCELLLTDLLGECPVLREHGRTGTLVGGINVGYRFSNGKVKTIDLGIGTPRDPAQVVLGAGAMATGEIGGLRIACEAKQCMTEHSKSQPRIFDELSSSHEIVHQGDREAIACGIVVVNIAPRFASPLRQKSRRGPLIVTEHRQPDVAAAMVHHLRGLRVRESTSDVGFDAFATLVINCDNTGPCHLHTAPPAPQPGDPDHYATFLQRISRAYEERYGGRSA